jgi:hypothetical protein
MDRTDLVIVKARKALILGNGVLQYVYQYFGGNVFRSYNWIPLAGTSSSEI